MKGIVSFCTRVGEGVPVRVAPESRSKTFRAGRLLVLLACVLSAAIARESGFGEFRAVQESLSRVPPKLRLEWMHERGIELPGYTNSRMTDSGLALVGKWGRGPAGEVTGKDTLVVLTLGSEVALLSFANPDSPRVLSEIQFPSLTAQSYLEDSLLYTSSNADLEVWNVANPTQPVKRGQLLGPVGDFWIRDTFLYFIRSDTFHVLSIANPANLRELGSCAEAGSATTGSDNTVVVCQSGGFAFVDVSNPASPHEVGTYPCGHTLSATARGNLVCVSFEETSDPYPVRFITLDISTPSSPRQLARLNDLGGYDIYLDSSLAFVSGRGPGVEPQPFQIVSIADSAHPVFLDSCRTTARYPWGVWANLGLHRVLVADEDDGLGVVDISNINSPVFDTSVVVAASAEDVSIAGHYCYVANGLAGLKVLDLTNPTQPTQVGELDTLWNGAWSHTVLAHDSFAFIDRIYPCLRVVDVSDPAHPVMAGGSSAVDGQPQDMVLRDSFLYIAENYQFQIVNVARPRAPQVVGTLSLPDYSSGLCVQDSLAYVSTYPLAIINVSNPSQPEIVGSIARGAWSVFVKDMLAYLPNVGLFVWNVANPAAPTPVDSLTFGHMVYDVVVVDSLAYLACSDGLRLANVADPHNMRVIALHSLPYIGWRLVYDSPYVYVATQDAGVCIFETTATGVAEATKPSHPRGGIRLAPNPARNWVDIIVTSPLTSPCRFTLFDATGREVASVNVAPGSINERRTRIELGHLAPGLYFLRAGMEGQPGVLKIVKQ